MGNDKTETLKISIYSKEFYEHLLELLPQCSMVKNDVRCENKARNPVKEYAFCDSCYKELIKSYLNRN